MDYLKLYRVLLIYTVPVFLSISLCFLAVFYKRISKGYKLIYYYLVFNLFFELLQRFMIFIIHSKNNLFTIPASAMIKVIIISIFYFKYMFQKKRSGFLAISGIVMLLLSGDLILSITNDPKEFNSFGVVLANLLFIILALVFLYETLVSSTKIRAAKVSLNNTILVYCIVSLGIYVPLNFLVNESIRLVSFFWLANMFIVLFYYLFLAYFIWKDIKRIR